MKHMIFIYFSKIFIYFSKIAFLFVFTFFSFPALYAQETMPVDVLPLNQNSEIEKGASGCGFGAKKPQSSNDSKNRGGLVITAYLGAAKTASTDLKISQPDLNTEITFEDVRLRSRSFESPQYYGLRAGYFFRRAPFIGAEAEFIHLKVYSDPEQRVQANGIRRGTPINREIRLGQIVQQYSISHGVNLLLFNLAVRRGFAGNETSGRSRFILTGRSGIGLSVPHTESRIEGQAQEQYEIGRFSWQLAGSAEFRLIKGLYFLGEYKYTQTRQRGKIFSGTAESFLRTHQGVFGLSYHF